MEGCLALVGSEMRWSRPPTGRMLLLSKKGLRLQNELRLLTEDLFLNQEVLGILKFLSRESYCTLYCVRHLE